jgi:hypothetical protein
MPAGSPVAVGRIFLGVVFCFLLGKELTDNDNVSIEIARCEFLTRFWYTMLQRKPLLAKSSADSRQA